MSNTLQSMSLEQLRAERDRINAAIAVLMGDAPAVETKRKSNKNKGKPTVWGDFSKKIQAEHKQQIIDYKAAHPGEKSPHLAYVTQYRKDHTEIYDAFKVAWKEAHPDTDAGSVAEEAAAAAEAEGGGGAAAAKPKRVISDEQKAKMKAGRERKKAEKDAAKAGAAVTEAAPVAAAPVAAAPVAAAPVAAAVVPTVASLVKGKVTKAKA